MNIYLFTYVSFLLNSWSEDLLKRILEIQSSDRYTWDIWYVANFSPQTRATSRRRSQVSESSPHDPLASLNSIDFHFLYLHEATAAYSCRVLFASGAEVRLSRSLRGTQTQGTEKWERPQEPKSWGWKSEERLSRDGWWHFQWTLLKTQSGLYLKSVEELQIGEKSPFLEIGTKWGKTSWSPEVGLPEPRWRGAIGWMNSEVPSGFMMLGD